MYNDQRIQDVIMLKKLLEAIVKDHGEGHVTTLIFGFENPNDVLPISTKRLISLLRDPDEENDLRNRADRAEKELYLLQLANKVARRLGHR